MKRLTQEEFIEKATHKHNNKYIYSKVAYTSSNKKIVIICPTHGEFSQEANSHLRGIGCPKCSNTYRPNTNEFIKRASIVHCNKYDYSISNYKRAHSKIKIICPTHGKFEQTPSNHLNNHGCPLCGINSIKIKNKKSEETFLLDCENVHGKIYDYSLVHYINSTTKVKIVCKEHGVFEQEPHSHLNGAGCYKCYKQRLKNTLTKTTEKFIEDAIRVHSNKYDYSLVKYIGTDIKIKIICRDHGVFTQKPTKHLQNQGCPICSESKLEKKIRILLTENNIRYIQQYGKLTHTIYLNGQLLDFYLPDYKIAIECQGEQHFKPVDFGNKGKTKTNKQFEKIKLKDIEKLEKCNKYGIDVIYFCDITNHQFNYLGSIYNNMADILEKIKNKNE